jgi:hypothetical protein
LPTPGFALEQDRLPHPDGQEQRGAQLVASQVADRLQGGVQVADVREPVVQIVRQGAHKVRVYLCGAN